MKIAILGARGFLGRNLCNHLLARGHEVTGYVLETESAMNENMEYKSVTNLAMSRNSTESPYEVTINLAARRSTRAQPFSNEQVNDFTYEIPKVFIQKTAGPNTLVLNSSTYIQNFRGISGQTVDSYGIAKERLSRFLEVESSRLKYKVRDLYFFTLYGPGDRASHLVPLLLGAARTKEPILLSPGHQLMNLLFIDDAIQNILKSISQETDLPYQRNFVWSDEYFSVRELVERIQSAIGLEINCLWGKREYVGHEMLEPWTIPMERLPGFTSPTVLEEGIVRTWKSIGIN